MTIGQRIKSRREELQLTQEELAQKMGYKTRNAIYQYEQAENMKLSLVQKFATALNCTPLYLMGMEETLTEENANFSVDMLEDPEYLTYAKKLFYASNDIKQQAYKYIDFLLAQ